MGLLISIFVLIGPASSFGAAKFRQGTDQSDCESRLAVVISSSDQLIEALEAKADGLAKITNERPPSSEKFAKTFAEIQSLINSYDSIPTQPSTDDFTPWVNNYELKIDKLFEAFISRLSEPLSKPLASKMLNATAESRYTWVVRLSLLRSAVSHPSFTALDLDRQIKGRLLSEALSISTVLAPQLGSQPAFWGDLFMDLQNWSSLISPGTLDLLDMLDRVLSKSLEYVPPGALTPPQIRFFVDTISLIPPQPGPRSEVTDHLRGTMAFIAKHKPQLSRLQPRLYERLVTVGY